MNSLLSFFYTLLAHDVEAALETVGLDPQVGFYHQERSGRASLALDMMEELRPYIVDRFVITMINKNQISKDDFLSNKKYLSSFIRNLSMYLFPSSFSHFEEIKHFVFS